ncbi:hypothetical protein KTN05_01755 [Paracoccus sp. Z118]|uniref:hypothetical protein n=1 Tax=Paracoccus sp. Z118 TaxID=2851017 RepID=UPI001C2C2427|nr:hypothetical protein [Paracoccus sp. Z118]MBV0890573.1 hypothetical protein [Paracoccus sp. Z118]
MPQSDRPVFGAPIDRSQETYRPSPYPSQKPLPHGDVSLDGKSAWPEPSLTSRIVVWGGTGIVAAALTAGAVLAVRKVADLVTGDDEMERDADREAEKARERVYAASRSRNRSNLAPRFADLNEEARSRMRARQRAREAEMERHTRDIRADAAQQQRPQRRRRKPQANLLGDIENTAQRMSRSAEGLVGSLSAAMAGFRQVAGQAEHVIREFHQTADDIRSLLGTGSGGSSSGDPGRSRTERWADDASRARRAADPYAKPLRREVVDMREDETPPEHTDDSARTHRL